MAIISGINLLSREKVRKLIIEKWGVAFTEAVRGMDGDDYCTTCLVCLQFQWDCIIFNRHIISTKSQGFFQTPQDIMEEYNGCLGKNNNRLMVWQFQRIQVALERI